MPTLRELAMHAVFSSARATTDALKFDRAVGKAKASMDATAASGNKLTGMLKGVAVGFAASQGVAGIQGFVKGVIDTNVQAQKLQTTLLTLAKGQKEVAAANVDMISRFAVETPFALGEITDAFITLKAAGIEPTVETLRRVGDFASATGSSISVAAESLVKAGTGKFAMVMGNLKLRVEKLGNSVKLTGFGVEKTVKRDFNSVTNALLEFGSEFDGAMKKQVSTLGGRFSNLGDAMTKFRKDVGKAGFNDALNETLALFIGTVGEGETLATTIGRALAGAFRTFNRAFIAVRDNADTLAPIFKAIGVVLGGRALTAGAGAVLKISKMFKLLSIRAAAANAAMLVVPASIAAIGLMIQDVVVFLQGGNSLIGEFLGAADSAGGRAAEIGGFIRELITTAANAVRQILPTLVQIGQAILGALKSILPVVASIFAQIGVVIAQLIPLVVPVIQEIGALVVVVLKDLLPPLLEIFEALMPIVILLVEVLVPVIKFLVKFLAASFKVLAKVLGGIFKAIGWVVDQLVTPIINAFAKIEARIKAVFDFFMGLIGPVIDFFKDMWGNFKRKFPELAAIFETVFGAIADAVTAIFQWIAETLKKVEGVARDIAEFLGIDTDETYRGEALGIEQAAEEESGRAEHRKAVRDRQSEYDAFEAEILADAAESGSTLNNRQERIDLRTGKRAARARKRGTKRGKARAKAVATAAAGPGGGGSRGLAAAGRRSLPNRGLPARAIAGGATNVSFTGPVVVQVDGTQNMTQAQLKRSVSSGARDLASESSRQMQRDLRRGGGE